MKIENDGGVVRVTLEDGDPRFAGEVEWTIVFDKADGTILGVKRSDETLGEFLNRVCREKKIWAGEVS